MAYIPIIKNTKWIDLSDEHKQVREILEQDTKSACCYNGHEQPIMLQGAFGIGKTTALFYMFHYGWEVLKTPTFYIPLAYLVEVFKKKAESNPSGKVQNVELSKIISAMINEQISALNSPNWLDAHNILFPDFQEGINLQQYLEDFEPIELFEIDKGSDAENYTLFSAKVIKDALNSGHKPLLLIDEFESKFFELKMLIESSGGGVLRNLFDDIVQFSPFYLIIGNGPASGYEVAKERGDNDGSNTADTRRLKLLQVPFPTVNLLKESFMKGKPNGYVNFIWWMSRCRPGHIQELCNEVEYERLKKKNYSEFTSYGTFHRSVESMGEDVKFLKTSFFSAELDSHITSIIPTLLLELEPKKVTITDNYREALKKCTRYFYCGKELISLEDDLRPALQDDILNYLDKRQKEGKYNAVDYLKHLNKYFYYILSACTNEDGELAFNMFLDKERDETFAQSFLIPLLELTYDFICQYEDDTEQAIKEAKDFVLECLNLVNDIIRKDSSSDESIDDVFEETYYLFDTCKVKKDNANEELFLQFSLKTIREIIEQPIGSPILTYKGATLEDKILSCNLQSAVMTIAELSATKIYFIPSLAEDQMTNYVHSLKKALQNELVNLRCNAYDVIKVVSLNQNSKIDNLREELLKSNSEKIPEAKLRKISFTYFDDYQFNIYSTHIKDFLDSVCKISVIGYETGDLIKLESDNKIEISSVIDQISQKDWTPRKEDRRTIEHFAKLVTEGDQSILSIISAKATEEYDKKIEEYICKKSDYEEEIYCDFTSVYDTDSVTLDSKSKYLALYFIFENANKHDSVNKTLLSLLKDIGDKDSHSRLSPKKDNVKESLNFEQIYSILSNQEKVDALLNEFDKDSGFNAKLQKFVKMMASNTPGLYDTTGILNFMSRELDGHWITNYNSKMSSGFTKGAVLMRLLLLNSKASNINVKEKKDSLYAITAQKVIKLDDVRKAFETSTASLYDYFYVNQNQNFKSENKPFKIYQNDLVHISTLLTQLKLLLTELPECLSLLIIAESILIRIDRIISSAQLLNEQICRINLSLESKKGKILKDYQEKINLIFNDPIAVKLIEITNSNSNDKYNDKFCLKKYFGRIKNENELKDILTADYFPAKEAIIDDTKIKNLYDKLNAVFDVLKPTFEAVLAACQKCESRANAFNSLVSSIDELLKFEK